jgi:TM2 domain-containing membrane protein YozV
MKNTGLAYLFAMLGFLTPAAGVHRIYLGRPVSGLLYLLTWGFLGIGTMIDFFLIPRMVDDANRRLLYPVIPAGAFPPPPTREHQILRAAREHGGVVTVELVALQSAMSLADAKQELERLRKEGHCSMDVSTEGAMLYVFEGLRSLTPLELT